MSGEPCPHCGAFGACPDGLSRDEAAAVASWLRPGGYEPDPDDVAEEGFDPEEAEAAEERAAIEALNRVAEGGR